MMIVIKCSLLELDLIVCSFDEFLEILLNWNLILVSVSAQPFSAV